MPPPDAFLDGCISMDVVSVTLLSMEFASDLVLADFIIIQNSSSENMFSTFYFSGSEWAVERWFCAFAYFECLEENKTFFLIWRASAKIKVPSEAFSCAK